MGVAKIGLTGGEPMLREDIVELVSSIDKRSVSILETTGFNLTQKKAKELKGAGLFAAAIGLDHYKEDICDQKKGFDGAFKTSVKAIKNSRSAGIYTMMQTAVTKEMVSNNELKGMADLAKKLKAHEIRFLHIYPAGRLLNTAHNLDPVSPLPDNKDTEKIIEFQRKINNKRGYPKVSSLASSESESKFGCGAGAQHSYIDAVGNLYPCDFVPLSFGNIRDVPVRELWQEMHNLMGPSKRRCFLEDNIEKIRELANGTFPLSRSLSDEICRSNKPGDLPDFYKTLSGVQTTK